MGCLLARILDPAPPEPSTKYFWHVEGAYFDATRHSNRIKVSDLVAVFSSQRYLTIQLAKQFVDIVMAERRYPSVTHYTCKHIIFYSCLRVMQKLNLFDWSCYTCNNDKTWHKSRLFNSLVLAFLAEAYFVNQRTAQFDLQDRPRL